MNDFVKALIHVHGKTDEKAQWKRAVESVEHMSIMETAVAWQTLAHHVSRSQFPASALSEMKVMYKNALRENKEKQTPESQPCTKNINTHLKQLTEEIRGLRTAVCMDHSHQGGMVNTLHQNPDNEPIEDDSSPRTPSSDMVVSSGTVSVDADRPVSAPERSKYTAEIKSSTTDNRNPTAMDELIKKCCTDTSTSIIQLKDEIKEIHNELLQRWGDYEAESSKRANDAGVEIREIIERQFSTQDLEISKEFSDQSDAMESHEQYIEQVMDSQRIALEQTSQTMQTILSILENHDAFTRKLSGEHNVIMQGLSEITAQSRANTATLKTTVEKATGERGRAISELSSNTTKAVGEFVNALAVLRELYTSHEKQTLGMIAETRGLVDEIKQNLSKTTVSQAKSGGKKREDLLEREGNRLLQPEESPFAGSVRPNHKKEVSDDVQRKGNPFGKR
jgi:hypothetical protein